MDVKKYFEIKNDKSFYDFKKMHYKYKGDFDEFCQIQRDFDTECLPIKDFSGNNLTFIRNKVDIKESVIRLMSYRQAEGDYGIKYAEEEIIATNRIENINFNRKSVRDILKGMAPADEAENRILGRKKGLEFIADTSNKITEENLYRLYNITVGDFLSEEEKLLPGSFYRHDSVYITGATPVHAGINHTKLPEYMENFIDFINREDGMNIFVKAAVVHFYMAYLHPYFDGNGRMARIVHLWYLVQQGYSMALFIPFSSLLEKDRNRYYKAFDLVEENRKFCGSIDVTAFAEYFNENVYMQIEEKTASVPIISLFSRARRNGEITEKEMDLWQFVLSCYGNGEFSTKQLEKDCGFAAYATIYKFVNKFEDMGLLKSRKFSNRVKYSVNG